MAQNVLTKNKIADYLFSKKWYLPFNPKKTLSVQELTGGRISHVYQIRITTNVGQRSLILKQVLEQPKLITSPTKLAKKRIFDEARLLRELAKLWPQRTIPQVYYLDKKNYLIIMSDIQVGKKLLATEWQANHLYPQLAAKFGFLFAQLHSQTYKSKKNLATALKKIMLNYYLPVHLVWGAKKYFSKKRIDQILQDSNQAPASLIWLDPVLRNIYVKQKSISLIDFEFCLHHDPAIDLGIFLSYWLIKTQAKKANIKSAAWSFLEKFIKNYKRIWLKNKPKTENHLNKILLRTINWLGIYLLAQVDGKTGSEIKNKKLKQQVRSLGIKLLNHQTTKISQRLTLILGVENF